MTIEEFNATHWGLGMYAEYCGSKCKILSVNFYEALLELEDNSDFSGDGFWVRCENVTLVKSAPDQPEVNV